MRKRVREINELKASYFHQGFRAYKRGIEFLLSFDEWLEIWENSGHLNERGRYRDSYVMSRNNDEGPYATWNVTIKKNRDNVLEATLGRFVSAETRERLSKANTGKKLSEEHKAKLRLARKNYLRRTGRRA